MCRHSSGLGARSSLTRQEARRRNDELFETFIKMMDYAQREKVRAVLVAGDLFDSENGREAVRKRVLEAVAAHPQVDFLVFPATMTGNSFLIQSQTVVSI